MEITNIAENKMQQLHLLTTGF